MTLVLNPADHPAGTRLLYQDWLYGSEALIEISVLEWSPEGRVKAHRDWGDVWLDGDRLRLYRVVEVLGNGGPTT